MAAAKPRPAQPRAGRAKRSAGLVGRTAKKTAAKKTPAKTTTATKAPARPGPGKKGKVSAAQRRAEAERLALLAKPPLTAADLVARVPGIGPTDLLARATGGLAALAAVLLLIADLTPYLTLTGTVVRAPLDGLGILARAVLTIGLLGPGVLLLLGRGGRAALGLLLPFAVTAVGTVLAVFAEASTSTRPATRSYTGRAFFFGQSYATDTTTARTGHTLALAGYAVLVVVLVLLALAWPGLGREDRVPLGAARLPAAGFGIAAGLVGAVALCLSTAAGVVQTTTAEDGITEVPVTVLTPPGPFGLSGLAVVAGLLVAAGVLVAGTAIATVSTRAAAVGGLLGLALYLVATVLVDLRDIAQNDLLVPGVRTYALGGAALIALTGAAYVARVRRQAEDVLGSAEESRLGVPADELV